MGIPVKRKQKMYPLLIAGFILLVVSFILDQIDQKDHYQKEPFAAKTYETYNNFSVNRSALFAFMNQHFLADGLMPTELVESPQKETAGGKDYQSQSVGLLLLYYVETNQPEAFINQYDLAKNRLRKDNGLFQWRTRASQLTVQNRSADDLRIGKALAMAANRWGSYYLKAEAENLSHALIANCTLKDRLLIDDTAAKTYAPLNDLDLSAMLYLAAYDPEWDAIAKESLHLIQKSRFPYNPFYVKSNIDDQTYVTMDNVTVILHLAQTGQNNINDLRWLRFQLKKGPVYESYNALGRPISKAESPAIYGVIAQVGKYTKDAELYNLACDHLVELQNKGLSDVTGGYTEPKTDQGKALDHLMALLGF